MKFNILHIICAAAVLLPAACTKEYMPLSEGARPFSVTVTDGGYVSEGATRASESGYATSFTSGDACGLYVVRNGGIVYENIKVTASTSGTTLTWTLAETLYGGLSGESYYLYYPYQSDMSGMVTASASSDSDFFATLISSWTPKTDQSSYSNYTASDLMTAKGSATTSDGTVSLSFTTAHRMALAVIVVPTVTTTYTFTDSSIPSYTCKSSAAFFANATNPYVVEDGRYRYIVNPSSPATIDGSNSNGVYEFSLSTSGISRGAYKTFNVSSPTSASRSFTLQRGDFLFRDGTLAGKNVSLNESQKAYVSGIVFWSPAETDTTGRTAPASLNDDKIMNQDFPGCKHGLAVAVTELLSSGYWSDQNACVATYHQNDNDYGGKYSKDDFASITNTDYVYGYQNTVMIKAYNEKCATNARCKPVVALDSYEESNPAPSTSTGWYFPSGKELRMLCYKDIDNKDGELNKEKGDETLLIVDSSLGNCGGKKIEKSSYWTSTEVDTDYAYYMGFYLHNMNPSTKRLTGYKSRAVCAF